ncbi:MAG TPA: DUF1549 domain-containing protein [Vicinamibacterales bacterium]|nr:DUF1549 domain-containing protein [Vicinamibacterales bacterium]
MIRRCSAGAASAVAAAVWVAAVATATAQRPAPRRVDFARQIQPLLAKHCLECHNQDRRQGGLSLATYADALDGGRNGFVIRPGAAARSLLIHRVTGAVEPQMPKDETPLSPAEIALVQRWIDEGARETPASPAAPQPWEPPLALAPPATPTVVWPRWSAPLDRFVASYLAAKRTPQPSPVADAQFARRVYLDAWGLLPTPEELRAFLADTRPGKRAALVDRLLADNDKYAEHWISFWNDLLRNEDGVTYFSETAGRKSITDWLLPALAANLPYDRFVTALLNPAGPADPEGFLIGVNWRGETSAAVTPWMQAAQNTAQVFLGINLKCNACHDSFVNRWKLKDAYSLAAYFSPEPSLQLYRCDVAQNKYAGPAFLFPELDRAPRSSALADRRAAAAAIFTDPRNGRLPRTLVNRVWHRLFGRGLVVNPDDLDGRPWSPPLLEFLAHDFVASGYDMKRLIATIMKSRAYEMPAVTRTAEAAAHRYAFAGPEVRRLTAEQFADAIGALTGEWNVYPGRPATPGGAYAREWRTPSSALTRALGRPIRDQVHSMRAIDASTLQALELVNGEIYTRRLARGARRLLGEIAVEPASLYNRAVAGRNAASSPFDIDVSRTSALWLVVQEAGSNAPEAVRPAWAQAELVGPDGPAPLSALTPRDASGLRAGAGPLAVPGANGTGVRVRNPSVLVYDIAGRGFTRLRGVVGLENPRADIGSTLNPQVRFFVFDTAPDMERLIPPAPGTPLPPPAPVSSAAEAVDRVFWHLLGRAPSAAERRIAEAALRNPEGSRPSAAALADFIWAVTMKPEFQFVH